MHAILARLYHAAGHALHILDWPVMQAAMAAVLVAGAGRILARPRLAAGLALLAGSLAIAWKLVLTFPEPPVARLPGAAIMLILAGLLERQVPPALKAVARKQAARAAEPRRRWWQRPALCLLLAWWLRGTPLQANAILNGMGLFLGLLLAWTIAERLARGDRGWSIVSSGLALAGSLQVAGVSPHWVPLAAVPTAAALTLLGVAEAMPVLLGGTTIIAAAALVASDRGRFLPADVACLMPLVALALAPRLLRSRPAAGALLAAGLAVAITYIARSGLPALR